MTGSSINFIMPGWWPWAVAGFVLVAAASGWISIRRPHPVFSAKTRMVLWGLRAAAGLLLLGLILDWRVDDKREAVEKPMIRVLVDRSASMATQDAPGGQSRFDQATDLVASTIKPLWSDDPRLAVSHAGSGLARAGGEAKPDAPRSALGRSLRELLDSSADQALGAVILFSDGAASDPEELQEAASRYRTANIPVYPWITGTADQPADVRILSAKLHQPSPSQPGTRLEMTVESPGYAGRTTELTIGHAGSILHRQALHLDGGVQQVTASFISPHLGCEFYDIALEAPDGEIHKGNNRMRAACDLRRNPVRVLYMEGSDPKETAFLKDALEADPEMSVTCLHFPGNASLEALAAQALAVRGKDRRVFHDKFGREVPSVCHPTRGYPATLDELLQYDVVIDSDIIKEAFSPQQMANTVEFVERFGGGFVMVGGFTSFGAGDYETTVFNKLMPVEIANRSDPMSLAFRPRLTPAGLDHPIMWVGESIDENRDAWDKRFPYFNGINYARRAKPGAHVLAQAASPSLGQGQDLVLFAVQDIGHGRTMAFMSDTTEGWGTQFETMWGTANDRQRYFRKFWNNTIRWLAEERIAHKSGGVGINAPATRVTPGDVVPLSVLALPSGDHSGLEVTLRQEGKDRIAVPMQWNGVRHLWEGSFVPQAEGDIVIEAAYRSADGKPVVSRAGIHVDSTGDESIAVATRPALMEELARETGGAIVNPDNIKETLASLASRSSTVVWKRNLPVWDKWWVMLPFLLLVVSEWCLRRLKGRGPTPLGSPKTQAA